MKYFAGLDVALEETTICVVDEDGQIVKEARADSEPEALLAVLSGFELCFERIGLEACSLTAWLHEGLRSAGLTAICIDMRKPRWAQCRTRPIAMTHALLRRLCEPAGSAKFMSRAHHVVPGALFS
jgi:transposase